MLFRRVNTVCGRGDGGDHISNQGIKGSQNDNATYDNIQEDDRNVNVGNRRNGCSYKEFVACKSKEFDGKGGAVAYIRWVEKIEAVQDINGCGDNRRVKYSAGSLTDRALTWWNSEVMTIGRKAAVGMTWENFKALMKREYCPSNEMQWLETEFWSHSMVGAGHSAYTDRFHELARLVPHLVTPETKRIKRYIYGLALQIRGVVAATEPSMIQNAILKVEIMAPTMTTRNAGRRTAATRDGRTGRQTGRGGGKTGGRTGRGGGRTGEPTGRVDGRTGDQDGQADDQSIKADRGVDEVPDLSAADQLLHHEVEGRLDGLIKQVEGVENQRVELVDELVIKMVKEVTEVTIRMEALTNVSNGRSGCSYKEFLACSLKDYDRKGVAIVYTRWTKKIESVHDMSGCEDNQKVKYTVGSFIGKALTWWNTQVQTRGQETTVSMTWEDFKTLMRKELCPNNKMEKLETKFWCHTMVEAGYAEYIDRFHELAMLVFHLVTPENKSIERYIYGLAS
nr:reverse transcriptase domain-containing protein [Tanacetum cinerariifolium]